MTDDRKSGLQAAVELTREESEPPEGAATEQLPLIPAGELHEGGEPIKRGEARRRGPGRPPGARNKSTDAWRDFILARYQSPLIALAETYSRSVVDLKDELGCSLLEAFQLQQQAAKELAPYLHSKMPQAVQVDAKGDFTLIIEGGAGGAVGVPGDDAVVIEGEIGDMEKPDKSEG